MASDDWDISWQGRPMIHPPIVVPVIVHRLKGDCAITALVHADDAHCAIVNVLDLVPARHVS
jgi:hypothetical protein